MIYGTSVVLRESIVTTTEKCGRTNASGWQARFVKEVEVKLVGSFRRYTVWFGVGSVQRATSTQSYRFWGGGGGGGGWEIQVEKWGNGKGSN